MADTEYFPLVREQDDDENDHAVTAAMIEHVIDSAGMRKDVDADVAFAKNVRTEIREIITTGLRERGYDL